MKSWTVELTTESETNLKADFKSEKITSADIKVIKRWVADVENQGLESMQKMPDWRDHELEGEWSGHHAVSFSYTGRIIYRVENEKVIVRVVRVTADHNYKKERS